MFKQFRSIFQTTRGFTTSLVLSSLSNRPVDAIAINACVGVSGRFIETDLAAEMNMVTPECGCCASPAEVHGERYGRSW
jgi:hypothetical protein